MEVADQELVVNVIAGAVDDYRLLVERHQQRIFRFAFGLLGSREAAEDVTQEVFLSAYANLSGYDARRSAFSTWIMTIGRNRCFNLLKRNRSVGFENPNSIPDQSVGDPIANGELSQQLDQALAALPLNQRAAFVLAEVEQLSYAEIAHIERTSLGTVKSRIHRAKQQLRELLQPIVED